MSDLIITARLVSEHGQFYVHDSSLDPFEPFTPITDDEVRAGWMRNPNSIWYRTVGELWVFRLDLLVSSRAPGPGASDRMLIHNLLLPTGNLVVHDHPRCSLVLRP